MTAYILDAHGCGVDTHVFIYTHTPSAADSLRPRDGTQWTRQRQRPQDTTQTYHSASFAKNKQRELLVEKPAAHNNVLEFTRDRRLVLGFEGGGDMQKLNFSGSLPNTFRNNKLKLHYSRWRPAWPPKCYYPQNIMTKGFSMVFYSTGHNDE